MVQNDCPLKKLHVSQIGEGNIPHIFGMCCLRGLSDLSEQQSSFTLGCLLFILLSRNDCVSVVKL